MSNLLSDLRYSARRLARSPGFTLAAVASLALGIGATTAIYSIVHTLLVRPLAGIAEPERLVDIGRTERGGGFDTVGYPDLVDYRANVKALDQLFGWNLDPFHVRVGSASVRVLGYAVSANYFEALGVRPAVGRFFLPEEDSQRGGAAVAVASHDFFARELAGDAAKIGTIIRVDSRPFTLVGVTPADFHGHIFGLHPEIFVPLSTPVSDASWQTTRLTSRAGTWLILGGRLAPGATLSRVQAELDGVSAQLAKAYPDSHGERGARALPMKPVPGPGRTPVALFSTLLFALVGFVLAIACMNVASMLLARADERQREIAVRQALGAPRGRIVRQLLAESALLFLLAAPAGLLLARWGVTLLSLFRPPTPFPVTLEFPVDWSAALFATAVSLATGILFGLAPALQAARRAPLAALHDGAASTGTRQLRLRRVLVGAQLALSLLLLVTAGLLLRALGTAQRIDPGFRPEGVVAYEFNFDIAGYSDEAARGELARLIDGARALPGVTGASASMSVPLDLNRIGLGGVEVDGIQSPSRWGFEVDANIVAPGFFSTLGIPVEGRDFDATDVPGDAHVAIVNRSFAARFFPSGALARTFYLREGESRVAYRIVGVAHDIRHFSLGESPAPFLWTAASQTDLRRMNLLVRTSRDLVSTTRAVETLARSLDPDLPPGPPQSLVDVAATSTLPQRLAASVAGSVGAVGLFLAAIGLYGVVAFVVAARRRELAVRIALGAERRDVIRFVLADAARPVIVGAVVGLALSFALSRLLSSLLFGLSPTDLATFAGVPVLLGLVALLAVLVPARRAAAINPAAALRSD
jgi:predicted permease